MKLVYVSQPYDRLFPPEQNSIGLIVYYTALELGRSIAITLYGKDHPTDIAPEGLPFSVRRLPVRGDRVLQKLIRTLPRAARWLGLADMADDHLEYRSRVRRLLDQDGPTLVHVMNYWNWSRGLKPSGSSRRLVLEMQCEWLSQRDHKEVARQLEVVDAVVAVSDHIATTFRQAFPDYPGIVATVGNGVDVDRFHPRDKPIEDEPGRKRRILFVGRVSPEKGIHTLIEAFAEVAKRFDDVELHIAGPHGALSPDFITSLSPDPRVTALLRFYDKWGTCLYQSHLEELIAKHGIGDRVRFLGNVPHRELVATYQNADVVANASLSESFGISVVEGMACGLPVVGTRIGGMCESIVNGGTGMLVEPERPIDLADALTFILEDRARAREMGREGRRRAVEHFSWQARADRLMAVYRRLDEGSGASGQVG
jgi:glycosyltransferase involved in cell wall biosynthesis